MDGLGQMEEVQLLILAEMPGQERRSTLRGSTSAQGSGLSYPTAYMSSGRACEGTLLIVSIIIVISHHRFSVSQPTVFFSAEPPTA